MNFPLKKIFKKLTLPISFQLKGITPIFTKRFNFFKRYWLYVILSSRNSMTRKPCPVCCPETNRKPEDTKKPPCRCCSAQEENLPPPPCVCKMPKQCPCGGQNPCSCKMCQVRAICTPTCNRCGGKVIEYRKKIKYFFTFWCKTIVKIAWKI